MTPFLNENLSKIKPPLGKAAGAQQAPLTQLEWNTDSKAKKQRRRRRCFFHFDKDVGESENLEVRLLTYSDLHLLRPFFQNLKSAYPLDPYDPMALIYPHNE